MRWPVSRLAYDAKCDEIDYLRAELAKAQDHIRRMQRKDAGMPEAPKEKQAPIVVPDDLSRHAWGNPAIGARMEAQAVAVYKVVGDWDRVREKLLPEGDAE